MASLDLLPLALVQRPQIRLALVDGRPCALAVATSAGLCSGLLYTLTYALFNEPNAADFFLAPILDHHSRVFSIREELSKAGTVVLPALSP